MANPTNLENFSFAVYYEYTNDGGTTWESANYVLGEGEAGRNYAQTVFDQLQSQIDSGWVDNVRNVAVRYASIQVWTDWDQTE